VEERTIPPENNEEKSKTQLIREFFEARPNQVISPTAVALALNLNKHVTSTIVHRLEGDGAIQKAGRGEYIFKKEVDLQAAANIYKQIYRGVAENIGLRAVETMTKMRENDFDQKDPVESIKTLATALRAWFGEEAVRNILLNLEKHADDEKVQALINEVKATLMKKA
jgi:predicted transcriptional regulator